MADIDTTPAVKNWICYANDLNRASMQKLIGPDPVDLTGATGWMAQARKTANDPVIAATATVTTTPDGLGVGECTVEWDGAELAALLAGADSWAGVWDVSYVAVNEVQPTTMFRGKLTVLADVTK